MKIYLIRKSQEYANKAMGVSEDEVDLKFLQNERSSLSAGNERLRLYTLYDYYITHEDFENAYAISLQVMLSEKKLTGARNPNATVNSYMYALKLRINSCFDTGRIKEVGELLDKDWKKLPVTEREKPENFNFFFYMKALYYWMSGKHKEGERFFESNIDRIMTPEYFEHYAEHLEVILPIEIVLEFSNGNYRKAVLSINEYQRMNIKKSHTKYFKDCELMRILIQAEMGNYDVMDPLIRNTLRKARQLGLSGLEVKFLNVLKKLQSQNGQQIFNELSDLFKKNDEKVDILWIFYLRDWIESKKSKIPLAEILRSRAEDGKVTSQ